MNLIFDAETLRELVRPIAAEIAEAIAERDADPTITLPEAEAAKRLGMTGTQLRDRRLRGEIVGTQLGGRWFFQLSELHDYARRNRRE